MPIGQTDILAVSGSRVLLLRIQNTHTHTHAIIKFTVRVTET